MLGMTAIKFRLELGYKSGELREIADLLQRKSITAVNLVNKSTNDSLIADVEDLKAAGFSTAICVHYAINNNYHRSAEASFTKLETFCQQLFKLSTPTPSLLLVSGGGARKKLNTVTALQQLAASATTNTIFASSTTSPLCQVPLCIAYNPYLTGEEGKEETQRLHSKLKSIHKAKATLHAVYLQFGTNFRQLELGLDTLHQALESSQRETQSTKEEVAIYGSVFIPTKKLLASWKFRPWNGVLISDEYLSNVESAMVITQQLLCVYREHGVVPVVETVDITTEKHLEAVQQLLSLSSSSKKLS